MCYRSTAYNFQVPVLGLSLTASALESTVQEDFHKTEIRASTKSPKRDLSSYRLTQCAIKTNSEGSNKCPGSFKAFLERGRTEERCWNEEKMEDTRKKYAIGGELQVASWVEHSFTSPVYETKSNMTVFGE